MRPYILYITCALLLGLASCSSEEELKPERDTLSDSFAPDPSATDAESVLRREFKQDAGSFLLFNDTLTKEFIGKDYNGDDRYKTETLDMGYNLRVGTFNTIKTYTYEYLTTQAEKEAAVAFIKNELLTHLPKTLRPFSWFVVKTITDNDDQSSLQALSGQRAVAIAVGNITDENRQSVATSILSTTLSKVLESKTKELQAFYDVCDGLYQGSFDTDDNPEFDTEINMQHLNEAGFIVPSYLFGSFVYFGHYPKKTDDMASFTDLIMNNSMDDIKKMYDGYPIVIEKAQILYNLFESIGYIF